MKNILYILSILAIGGAAFLGYDTKRKLDSEIALYEETRNTNEGVSADIKKTQTDLDDTKDALGKAETKKAELTATKSNEEAKERNLKAAIEKYQTEIDEADAKLADFEQAKKEVQEALKDAGDIPFNQIEGEIAKLEGERKQKQDELEQLTKLEEKLSREVTANRRTIDDQVDRLGTIARKMALNSVEGTVISVDPTWGFVIINLGQNNSNITELSNLLVSRGGQLIGRLKVTSLEPNQTICDIDLKSMKPGQRVQPGDSVILAQTPGS